METQKPVSKPSTDDVRKAAETARQWFATPEGEKALKGVVERGTPLSDDLSRARKIDPDQLKRPMGF